METKKEPKKCSYCGKSIDTIPFEKKIWINGQQVSKIFCSSECASYAQMGAEG